MALDARAENLDSARMNVVAAFGGVVFLCLAVPGVAHAQHDGDTAAVRSSPFADAIVVSNSWERRFTEGLSIGAQVGGYIAGRLRLTAKLVFLTQTVRDDQEDFPGHSSKAPSFMYAASAGATVFRSPHFALSPGVLFMRTNVGDFGNMVGLSVPFDWVTDAGARLGLEIAGGSAFGGKSVVACSGHACDLPLTFEDRKSGGAVWLQFNVGFGLNHP